MVRTIIVLFILSAAGLMSCSDVKLARSIDGKWETSLNLTDEYGDPFVKKLIYEFDYKANGEKTGGKMTEYNENIIEDDSEGIVIKCNVRSSIEGEYTVFFGDLEIMYYLPTLEVTIEDVEYSLSDDADFYTSLGMEILGDEIISEMIEDELEGMKKEVYDSLYEQYEADNRGAEEEGYCYPDLEVEGDTMSFVTSDMGRMYFSREY